MTGGTALSTFYFEHRLSDDLDFFTNQPFSLTKIQPFIEKASQILNSLKTNYAKHFDRHIYVFDLKDQQTLKIEFTYFEHPPLKKQIEKDGLLVDNLTDLGANKFFCLFDRFEVKDYLDIYFFVQNGFTLEKLHQLAEKKFKVKIDPLTIGALLNRGQKINFPPKKLFKGSIGAIEEFYRQEAYNFRSKIFIDN